MSLRNQIERQFGRPEGFLGRLAGAVMARRLSNRARNRWSVGLLGLEPGMSVLEVGFGPGLALGEIASRNGTGRVVGVDHSPAMLSMAERRNRKDLEAGRIELRCGGLEIVAGLAVRFDRILSVNVVQFWPDRQAALSILAERIAPGGSIVTVYQPRHAGASRADAERMAIALAAAYGAAGLADVATDWLELKVPVVAVAARRPFLTRTP